MNELALFAGAGGGILGGKLLGWRTVCAVERDAYAAQVLAQRQNDGILRPFPIWSDVTTFDGRPWRGRVDMVSGGFPCQDISIAGKGEGITGARSGLWAEFSRIIGEVRPRRIYVENSPMLTVRGLGVVLGDLAAMGYDAEWGCISAAQCGALHKRNRAWIVAHASGIRIRQQPGRKRGTCWQGTLQPELYGKTQPLADPLRGTGEQHRDNAGMGWEQKQGSEREPRIGPWPAEPPLGRVADGVAYRVDRLKAIGNGQVSRVAAAAFIQLDR